MRRQTMACLCCPPRAPLVIIRGCSLEEAVFHAFGLDNMFMVERIHCSKCPRVYKNAACEMQPIHPSVKTDAKLFLFLGSGAQPGIASLRQKFCSLVKVTVDALAAPSHHRPIPATCKNCCDWIFACTLLLSFPSWKFLSRVTLKKESVDLRDCQLWLRSVSGCPTAACSSISVSDKWLVPSIR